MATPTTNFTAAMLALAMTEMAATRVFVVSTCWLMGPGLAVPIADIKAAQAIHPLFFAPLADANYSDFKQRHADRYSVTTILPRC
jgi:hypothetical protein